MSYWVKVKTNGQLFRIVCGNVGHCNECPAYTACDSSNGNDDAIIEALLSKGVIKKDI